MQSNVGAILFLFQILFAEGFWRLLCDGSVALARIDPLMYFGEVSDHVHSIKGGSGKILNPFLFSCSLQTLCREWNRPGPAAMHNTSINCQESFVSELTFLD